MKSYGLLFFIIFPLFLFSQNKQLAIRGLESQKLDVPKLVSDSTEAKQIAADILQQLYESGYLAAQFDSLIEKKSTLLLHFKLGEEYKWVQLRAGNLKTEELQEIDLNDRLFLTRPFRPKQLSRFFKKSIEYFENKGYPFASIRLDSLEFDSTSGIKASLRVKRNQFYTLDSVKLKGNSSVNRAYLLQYLDLELEKPYREKSIDQIETRIQEIPFLELSKRKEVQYFEDYVKLILHLDKKKASRFDGVLGLLTNENDGSIELTGDVDLNLINAFNRGENLGLNWRKLKGNSQDLKINFAYPYFLNTPIGIDANFKLFRRDTTFIDLISRLGVSYSLKRGEAVRLFIENKSSNLLSRNRFLNQTNNALPPFGDIRTNLFGVGYRLQRFDYLYNPRKGLSIDVSFAAGRKRLEKIAALEEEQPEIYEGVELSTNQFNGDLTFQFFQPLGGRSTLLLANQSASTYSENLYQNELLRIGGLKILRGFDEESINVSTYSIFTLEYRFLLDRNSFFSVFSDGGYYESNSIGNYVSDTPLGLGAGISFETAAGIFTFNYAVGKQFDNPIDLRAAKIHFGFINFF
ncbi:MAG: hypothetical protein RIC95_00250 [Vicingaceae bacterium]